MPVADATAFGTSNYTHTTDNNRIKLSTGEGRNTRRLTVSSSHGSLTKPRKNIYAAMQLEISHAFSALDSDNVETSTSEQSAKVTKPQTK